MNVFSKNVWIKLLKTKAANPVAREFISAGRKTKNLQCEEGTEFINAYRDNNVEIII